MCVKPQTANLRKASLKQFALLFQVQRQWFIYTPRGCRPPHFRLHPPRSRTTDTPPSRVSIPSLYTGRVQKIYYPPPLEL